MTSFHLPQNHHHHYHPHSLSLTPISNSYSYSYSYSIHSKSKTTYKPTQNLTFFLFLSNMDQDQRHVSATSATNNPVLRCTTVCTLPFARLVAASRRRLFLSDCADRRSDDDDGSECGYSRAVLVLDMVWNLAFVVVAAGVLLSTLRERPSTPLRLWLCGYAFECILHMAFVFFEFRSGVRDSFSHTTYR